MAKEKINLEEVTALTKELFHEHYAGNLEPWFSYLCSDSVYLGTGEPLLFGGDAIRENFKGFIGKETDIVREEYYPVLLGGQAAQVCGQIIVESKEKQFRVITSFTLGWRIIGGSLRLVLQHNSYEYMDEDRHDTMKMDANTMRFVRHLLLERPARARMAIRSGTNTVFMDPYTVLYVQSRRKKTEFVCIDRVISCNSPIGELAKELPAVFYPLHRSYLVNTLYLVAIRRFEAELIDGITLPIPALTYQQVKEDLIGMVSHE